MTEEYIALIDAIPEDTDANFEELVEKIKAKLPDTCVIEKYDIEPVAFGLKKAKLRIRYPAEWGGTDKLEELIGKVEELQGVEGIAFSKA